MKITNFFKYLLILGSVFAFQSCEKGFEDPIEDIGNSGNLPWQATTKLIVNAQDGKSTLLWVHDLLTDEEYWLKDEVILDMQLRSAVKLNNFKSIDFYVTATEEDGYNFVPPYEQEGKFLTSVDTYNEDGSFTLTVTPEQVYDLFLSDFKFDRSQKVARTNDVFEIHWVINAKDGSLLDSRESSDPSSRFGFNTKVQDYVPPIWDGTFNYEYLEVSPTIAKYSSFYQAYVGKTGTITITQTGTNDYSVPNLLFNKYGYAGTLQYDFFDGKVSIIDPKGYNAKWHISNINGASLDIAWENKYSIPWDEWGTVRLTRTDGKNWPTSIYTE